MSQSGLAAQLGALYGGRRSKWLLQHLAILIEKYRGRIPVPAEKTLSQRDSILIVYGDQVQDAGKPHLASLAAFCEATLRGVISGIHILPFYPSSSDDGFSVKDYRSVDPALGDWGDVEGIGLAFRLMLDGVINHASIQGPWFRAFLDGEKPYRDYFLSVEGDPDLSQVVRPRVSPLLTSFETVSGSRRVWTTFSADQADLDYHHPAVLLDILDVLLDYARHGAQFIRLDAVAYLWKEIGSSCIHLPQTHAIIRLFRMVLDELAPHVRLITETNVSDAENRSYFGNGRDEAQLVYNFALPPLVLHTFRTGDASILSDWASGLEPPTDQTTFFNFLASHDGIGLNAVRGILSPDQLEALVRQTLDHGGLISYRQNPDGTQSPYELNINFFDALSNPQTEEPLEMQIDRFMAAQAIMLSLRGIPGIYFHSLFGSRNWLEGVKNTGRNRMINRQKFDRAELEKDLADPLSLRAQVFSCFRTLLQMRSASPAFHPRGKQKILNLGKAVFAVLRESPQGDEQVVCLQNISGEIQPALDHELLPYQTLWLKKKRDAWI